MEKENPLFKQWPSHENVYKSITSVIFDQKMMKKEHHMNLSKKKNLQGFDIFLSSERGMKGMMHRVSA